MAKKEVSSGTDVLKTMKVKVTGTSPLLMHNVQLASPFNPFVKELTRLNMEKKKIKKDDEEKMQAMLWKMAECEFKGGLYMHPTQGPVIGTPMLVAAMAKAGGLEGGWGATVSRSIFPSYPSVKLNYTGPRTANELWEAHETFADLRVVTIGQSKITRCRPIFQPPWSLVFEFRHHAGQIDTDICLNLLTLAGQIIGIGDGRKLQFGRFDVEAI